MIHNSRTNFHKKSDCRTDFLRPMKAVLKKAGEFF